jgi:hypothetical protein
VHKDCLIRQKYFLRSVDSTAATGTSTHSIELDAQQNVSDELCTCIGVKRIEGMNLAQGDVTFLQPQSGSLGAAKYMRCKINDPRDAIQPIRTAGDKLVFSLDFLMKCALPFQPV